MTVTSKPARFALTLLCAVAGGAWAAEYGTVVSATPLVMAIPVPQRQCTEEQVVYEAPRSGAGALIGAIAGAAVGNSVGSGSGRAAATGIGMIAGSVIGDRIEADAAAPVATTRQRCRTVTRYENRTVAYDVVYDYQGVRRSARLAQDPGPRIALDINIAPAGTLLAAPAPPPAPVYVEPAAEVVYEQAPPRVVYAPQAVYGPQVYANPWPWVVLGAGLGWQGGGWGGYGHGHGHRH
jgi:uncharacterized protein YcfJ